MENVAQSASNAATGVLSALESVIASLSNFQILLIIALFIVLAIILIAALVSRNRRYEETVEEVERQTRAAEDTRAEARRTLKEKEAEFAQLDEQRRVELEQRESESRARLAQQEAEMNEELERQRAEMNEALDAQRAQMNEALDAQRAELAEKEQKLEGLRQFHEEYKVVPDAQAEARRIIREAKDYAFSISNRTDREYAEIIQHATEEADAIRAMSQSMLTRSHEALRQAMARAKEIIDEARGEAETIRRELSVSAASVALLDRPDDQPEQPLKPESPDEGLNQDLDEPDAADAAQTPPAADAPEAGAPEEPSEAAGAPEPQEDGETR